MYIDNICICICMKHELRSGAALGGNIYTCIYMYIYVYRYIDIDIWHQAVGGRRNARSSRARVAWRYGPGRQYVPCLLAERARPIRELHLDVYTYTDLYNGCVCI